MRPSRKKRPTRMTIAENTSRWRTPTSRSASAATSMSRAPTSGPVTVPIPPMTTMLMTRPVWRMSPSSGLASWRKWTNSAPAMPQPALEMVKASVL